MKRIAFLIGMAILGTGVTAQSESDTISVRVGERVISITQGGDENEDQTDHEMEAEMNDIQKMLAEMKAELHAMEAERDNMSEEELEALDMEIEDLDKALS